MASKRQMLKLNAVAVMRLPAARQSGCAGSIGGRINHASKAVEGLDG
jgi:hypothetical protein